MKTAILILATVLTFGNAARAAGAADTPGVIDAGGVKRTYVVHVPAQIGASVPLILSFHGHGGDGAGQARLTNLDTLADRDGFIVVYPDGIRRGWNDGRAENAGADDIALVKALIADFSKRYPIDAKRIYATGFSNGGTFTEYLGCMMSSQIAAIAPVSGSMPDELAGTCRPQRAIPVLEIAGTSDPIMPYKGGEIVVLGTKRGQVLSAAQTISFWATNAKCGAPSSVSLPPIAPADATSVTREEYGGCAEGSAVELYTVIGGGHAWPGGPQYVSKAFIGIASTQLDASATIVAFFLAHPMR